MLSDDPVLFAVLSVYLFIYLFIYYFYLPCKAQDSILNLKDCVIYALYKIRIVSGCMQNTVHEQVYVHVHVCDCYCVDFMADTEGSFIVERVVDIADAAVKHMQHVVQSADMDETGTISSF